MPAVYDVTVLVSLRGHCILGLGSTSDVSRKDRDSQEWGQILARIYLPR